MKRHQQWKESRKSAESDHSDHDGGDEEFGTQDEDWDFSTMKPSKVASPSSYTQPALTLQTSLERIPQRKSSRRGSATATLDSVTALTGTYSAADTEKTGSTIDASRFSFPSPSMNFTQETEIVKVKLFQE